MVELTDCEIARERPRLAAVGRERVAAVFTDDDARRIVRRDPDRVVIYVNVLGDLGKLLAAVLALGERFRHAVDVIRIARVDRDVREVERPLIDERVVRRHFPRSAAVVGAPKDAAFGFDQRVDAVAVARRDREADAPGDAGRQAVADQTFPRFAAVARPVQSVVGAAAGERPRLPAKLPDSGVDDVGIANVHRDIARAAARPDVERLSPRASRVVGNVNAAIRRIGEDVAERADDDVRRVLRIDDDARDVARAAQADVAPRFSAVGRFVEPVAVTHVVARIALAGADVDDVLVARIDGDRTDCGRRLFVEDGIPRRAAVDALPHAAAGRADVVQAIVLRRARNGRDAAAGNRRPDRTPREVAESRRTARCRRGRCRRERSRRDAGRQRRHQHGGAQRVHYGVIVEIAGSAFWLPPFSAELTPGSTPVTKVL